MQLFAKFKKIDIPIIIILLIFMLISSMVVYSATLDDSRIIISIQKSILMYIIGFCGLFFMAFFDYRLLQKISIYIYLLGFGLIVTVSLFGTVINGARGWFILPGGFNFQPAELMKLILIISIASLLHRRKGERLEIVADIFPITAIVILPFVFVLIQPDLGNAVIYIFILLGMLWIGNVKYMHVGIGIIILVVSLAIFLFIFQKYHVGIEQFLSDRNYGHWVTRIDTFLDPSNASKDAKFQVENSIRAIGSGGLFGEGYLKGTSVHSNFIPYAYSDSIFVVVGEEFGFQGSAFLLLLYFILIYRLILISSQSERISGSYMVIGIVSMFVFQIFQNVGMSVGLMPLTGITLPFISYGGTSLLINMMSIGLLMSIKIHQDPIDD